MLKRRSGFIEGATLIQPLTPTSTPIERRQLTPHAFDVSASADVDGRSLMLIDDVYSSGATAQSSAAALQAGGAIVKYIVVIGPRLNPHIHPGIASLYDRQSRCSPDDWMYSPVGSAAQVA